MYICICHAIRDRDFQDAIGRGETTLFGIYKRLGCRPRCGKCLTDVAQMIVDSQDCKGGESRR